MARGFGSRFSERGSRMLGRSVPGVRGATPEVRKSGKFPRARPAGYPGCRRCSGPTGSRPPGHHLLICAELPLDDTWNRTVPFGLAGQKRLKMFGGDRIQKTVFGTARLVGGGKTHAPGPEACGQPTSTYDPVAAIHSRTARKVRHRRDHADRRFPNFFELTPNMAPLRLGWLRQTSAGNARRRTGADGRKGGRRPGAPLTPEGARAPCVRVSASRESRLKCRGALSVPDNRAVGDRTHSLTAFERPARFQTEALPCHEDGKHYLE